MKKKLLLNGNEIEINVISNRHGSVEFTFNGKNYNFSSNQLSTNQIFLTGSSHTKITHSGENFLASGAELTISPLTRSRVKGQSETGGHMLSPMPGKILDVLVSVGETVEKGAPLILMEAMKMEHTIKASEDGVVIAIHFEKGQLVAGGVDLVELKSNEDNS